MAKIKQIKDTAGTTHDIAVKWDNVEGKPNVGNGKVTIKQAGKEKGSFTLNQSGDATIELTDNNTTYTFATGDSNGQIKVTPSVGKATNISVKGLGSLAYKSSLSASDVGASASGHNHDSVYAPKSHPHDYLPLSGGTLTGTTTLSRENGSMDAMFYTSRTDLNSGTSIGFGIGTSNNRGIYDAKAGGWILKVDTNNNVTLTGTATKSTALTSTSKGSAIQPVYFDANGKPVACTYTLGKSVPSNAVFTDTDSKTSTSNKADTKLFLVGATSQSTSGQTTYSNSNCYVGTDNCLYSNDKIVTTGVIEVIYDELKELRDSGNLIPGQQYRITDYVTTTAAVDTQSAGHQFDIIVTALDNSTLCEEAHAIHNRGDEYFDSCNLEAWKIWYCLDNDTNRFGWAKEYIQEYISGLGNLYKFHNWVTAVAKVCDDQIDAFYETGINEKFSHFNYTENLDGIIVPTLYGRDLEGDTDNGLNIYTKYYYKGVYNVDGVDYDGWMQCYKAENDGEYSYANDENGNNIYILTERIVYNGKIENGKGVIYRMIDEWGNDCPYDFKNIKFKKWLYADGAGITTEDYGDFETYCYTFSWEDEDYGIMDTSVVGNNGYVTAEYGENEGVYGNVIGVWITGENGYPCQQLNSIVFLSTYEYDYGNYYGCYSNTFGENCYNNIFNSYCHKNTFGNNCYGNTFGGHCSTNTFSNNCNSNTFGEGFNDNTFGNSCHKNTFGKYCESNTFGNNCYKNTFGNNCDSNTFGNDFNNNVFEYSCSYNTFGNYCSINTFINNFESNTLGNSCHSNYFDYSCSNNTLGNNCHSNIFNYECRYNKFGNGCDYNTFGNSCECNTFGNSCSHIKFGNSSSVKSYYRRIIIDSGNQYIYLYCKKSTGTGSYYQNVRIGLGVNNSSTYKTINDSNVGQSYETLYIPTSSKTITI